MPHPILKPVIGLAAAAATTRALFSAVIGLAEDDRTAPAAARVAPTQVAALAGREPRGRATPACGLVRRPRPHVSRTPRGRDGGGRVVTAPARLMSA